MGSISWPPIEIDDKMSLRRRGVRTYQNSIFIVPWLQPGSSSQSFPRSAIQPRDPGCWKAQPSRPEMRTFHIAEFILPVKNYTTAIGLGQGIVKSMVHEHPWTGNYHCNKNIYPCQVVGDTRFKLFPLVVGTYGYQTIIRKRARTL